MQRNLLVTNKVGKEITITIKEEVDFCPHCHNKITPHILAAFLCDVNFETLNITIRCPNLECQEIFMAEYLTDSGYQFYLHKLIGGNIHVHRFEAHINDISPNFSKIFNEALSAQNSGLTEISGGGFRKALEFLIKDYAIFHNPGDKESIIQSSLGKVIAKYIEDPRIKDVSKRAAWLGNDEAHYYRVWEGKTTVDIKRLIELTVHWITMEKLTTEIIKDL